MNQFNQQLLTAKKKQRLFYLSLVSIFLIGILIVLTLIVASRGTRIDVFPDEAGVQSKIQLEQGLGLIVGDTLYSVSQSPSITVSAEGFQTLTQQVTHDDFGNLMVLTLKPLPANLELSTNIANEQTNWLINGETLAISAIFNHQLEAGDYELTVSHSYYQDVSQSLSLSRGELFTKQIQLELIDGKLLINSTPQKSKVSLNDMAIGSSPQDIALKGGQHNIKVEAAGYETVIDKIEISNSNLMVKRDYRLALKKVAVGLTLSPENGTLNLDNLNIKAGKKLRVEAGVKHTLRYSKPGYFSETKTFTLAADDNLNLLFELKKEMGKLEIQSTPDAEVKINGQVVGNTPLTLSLNAVEQKITLTKAGYRSISKVVIPSAENTKIINLFLLSEKVAKLKEAPQQYKHKAGGQLKLFKPNETFFMGAKRSDPGQRANEFIKQVQLTKPFYAGQTEVSIAEYQQFDKKQKGDANKPVTNVSWLNAAMFCNWLSQQEGLKPVYQINANRLNAINNNADGYRLLTEAEWEWLARKSGKKQQSTFVWGDDRIIPKNATNIADESANGHVNVVVPKYNDNFPNDAPIKSFAQESSGLYDQAGNVSEWTHDSYSIAPPKSGKVFVDPFDLSRSSSRVVKGANWRSGSITELRPAFREGLTTSRDDLGFRIARYVYGGN